MYETIAIKRNKKTKLPEQWECFVCPAVSETDALKQVKKLGYHRAKGWEFDIQEIGESEIMMEIVENV